MKAATKTITVPILDDALIETRTRTSTSCLRTHGPWRNSQITRLLGSPYVTIIDDENNPGTIGIPATPINVVESAGTVNVNVGTHSAPAAR